MYWVTFFKNYPLESDGNRIVFFLIFEALSCLVVAFEEEQDAFRLHK